MTRGHPYRDQGSAWLCDDCGERSYCVSIDDVACLGVRPPLPWRNTGKVRCMPCSDRHAWTMLNAAERRVCELELELHETRREAWWKRLFV